MPLRRYCNIDSLCSHSCHLDSGEDDWEYKFVPDNFHDTVDPVNGDGVASINDSEQSNGVSKSVHFSSTEHGQKSTKVSVSDVSIVSSISSTSGSKNSC